MDSKIFSFPTIVKEIHLDMFGHMNNASYLVIFEEARWDLISKNGFGVEKIKETGLGPTILEVKFTYLKELKSREDIVIQTKLLSYDRKIGKLEQTIVRGDDICARAEFIFGLFSLTERKLVLPTPDWLHAIGVEASVE
jgi:YbgC/YbaW family acyl-CoA thioester hydrolase